MTTRYQIVPISTFSLAEVLPLIVTAMRDNPQHIAAFGEDPDERERLLTRLFGLIGSNSALFTHSMVAVLDGEVVGICGLVEPGHCRPPLRQQVRMLPAVLRLGPGNAWRTLTWLGAWAKHDYPAPHWHMGPVAVASHLQGQGIGSDVLRHALDIVDAAGGTAWLETDKEINVTFYERAGFRVGATATVLGTTNWFMVRDPQVRADTAA